MMIRDHLGEEIYNDIMNNSQVGVLLKLALTSFIWSAKTVQYFVSNQLKVDRNHEFWTLIGGRPVRFSLFAYAEITGLNCDPIDPNDKLEIDHTEFWAEIGVREARMKTCQAWNYEKKKMLALLFILHVGVLGLHRNSQIPLALAKKVMDEAAFERQPWGRYGFHELIYSIKIANLGEARYTLHGCVQAMLVWGYECIPILAERAGKICPMWTSSRCRYVFETLLEMDKSETEDHKVRVRHLMVVKPLEEIYPVWEGEPRRVDVDIKVHNMICDILDGSLDEGFWESPKNKRKKEDEEEDDDFNSPVKLLKDAIEEKRKEKRERKERKERKEKEREKEREEKEREKQRENESKKKEPAVEKEDRTNEILMAINGLSTTVALLNSNVSSAVIRIDHWIRGLPLSRINMKRKMRPWRILGTRLTTTMLTMMIMPVMQNPKPHLKPLENVNGRWSRNGNGSCGKGSGTQSWMMEMQETSEPGFPVARVVRTPASRGKTVTKVKKEPADPKEKNQSGTKSKPDLKDKNEETQIINISDVSRPLQSRRVQIPSLQDEDDSAIEAMKKRLDKLVEHAKNPPAEKEKRGRSLAPTQVSPYLGNSVVRRIMDPAGPPPGRYDPFEAVDSRILDNLTHYLASPYAGGEFYLTLMTPKEKWPRKEYGWLHDQHMCKGLDMFRQRSMRYPSPYKGGRVAFIDPIFCRVWCGDYRTKFLPNKKSWIFSDGYLDVANGHYDHYLPTHKKWGTDVDFVYITHNVNNEHWVAVEVDIPKKRSECDCGIITLKTIECLALCHKWDQLKDSNMPLIRMKYAAEIFDEASLVFWNLKRLDAAVKGTCFVVYMLVLLLYMNGRFIT
ncbi:hypothetical protein EUTSA_v10027106mg [Eutrema salsugineum]|uniref:Ubiquitin-like protease family profile domain-containing protein n=1 Tax=Eutrema salsugineum TaxID=72664 RepID=V4M0A4_EUTSA|nr:hypothetical protein EUTSA_v10027106mg [Eutrema salsugineum]